MIFDSQIDYDECNPASSIHIQDCGTGATCTNQIGTYSCQCDTGYEGTPPGCARMYIVELFLITWLKNLMASKVSQTV
jgi:hypothetical protein